MDKIKVGITGDSKKVHETLYDVDIVVLAHIATSDNSKGVELRSSRIFVSSSEWGIAKILSRVECVKKEGPLHSGSSVVLFSTDSEVETNDFLKSLEKAFGDLEISI